MNNIERFDFRAYDKILKVMIYYITLFPGEKSGDSYFVGITFPIADKIRVKLELRDFPKHWIDEEDISEGWWIHIKNNIEIMQFTGFFDKEGVKVFENDIIEIGEHRDKEGILIPKENVLIEMKDGSYNINEEIVESYGVKIIGNVYKNKDLLIKKS